MFGGEVCAWLIGTEGALLRCFFARELAWVVALRVLVRFEPE
mgnify:CR=1 FL=1